MSQSNPMEISADNPNINAMPQLRFLAQVFKSSVAHHPRADIQIWGTNTRFLPFHLSNTEKSASIVIDFQEGPAMERFSIVFKTDFSFPVTVRFV